MIWQFIFALALFAAFQPAYPTFLRPPYLIASRAAGTFYDRQVFPYRLPSYLRTA